MRSLALTVFIFGLLVWVYVIVIQVTHTDWIYLPLSHIEFFPFNWRLDDVGMFAFGVSAAGFFLWQVLLNEKSE